MVMALLGRSFGRTLTYLGRVVTLMSRAKMVVANVKEAPSCSLATLLAGSTRAPEIAGGPSMSGMREVAIALLGLLPAPRSLQWNVGEERL